MALPSTAALRPLGTMGDALSSLDAGASEIAFSGLVLCHDGQSGDAHLLHDWSTHPVLVWLYEIGPSVSEERTTIRILAVDFGG